MKPFAILALAAMTLSAKPIYVPGADCTSCHIEGAYSRKYTPATFKWRRLYKGSECQGCHVAVNGKVTLKSISTRR